MFITWIILIQDVIFCQIVTGPMMKKEMNKEMLIPVNTRDVCNRDPTETSASKTPGDNGFRIKVSNHLQTDKYTPGQVYTGRLQMDVGNNLYVLIALQTSPVIIHYMIRIRADRACSLYRIHFRTEIRITIANQEIQPTVFVKYMHV